MRGGRGMGVERKRGRGRVGSVVWCGVVWCGVVEGMEDYLGVMMMVMLLMLLYLHA